MLAYIVSFIRKLLYNIYIYIHIVCKSNYLPSVKQFYLFDRTILSSSSRS